MPAFYWSVLLVVGTGAVPPYSVDHSQSRPSIVDADGRQVVFRGVNVGVEQWRGDHRPNDPALYADGKCPSAAGSGNQPPVCGVEAGKGKWNQSTTFDSKNDLAQMRALGFNLIRLAMSWSLLEPEPLKYSQSYLKRIAQVVDWAAEQDIQVILDMHQDTYGGNIGSDGAPVWACLNVTIPWWVEKLWPKLEKAIPYSKSVLESFDALYMNKKVASTGKGLQEHFMLAWSQVVKRFDGVVNVIGYEIINEPAPGILTTVDSVGDIPVLGFSTKYLFPMYRRFIQAMIGVRDGMKDCPADQPIGDNCAYPDLGIKSEKLVLFEPMALRNQLDFSLQISKPFTEYSNIVFAPHVYTYSFTASKWPPTYSLALSSAWYEAAALKASVLATEYGGSCTQAERVGNLTNQFDLHRGTSGTVWSWKENGNWGMYDVRLSPDAPNGPLKQVRQQINSRIYARAVNGAIVEHTFDQFTGSFHLKATNWEPANTVKPTEVYIPSHLKALQASVSGAATLEVVTTQPDGSRIVEVVPSTAGGAYEVSVGGSAPTYGADTLAYKGISAEAMAEVARAMWPLHPSAGLASTKDDALQNALAKVAREIYAPGRQQKEILV